MILTPKNWKSFQHYKDRAPAWIKLHKGLLDDFEFSCLPVASRALAPLLWLLASEYEDGLIDASLDKLAFRARMTRGEFADALSPLVQSGFFDASEPLADCKHDAIPEREKEKQEKKEEEKRENIRAVALDDDWPSDYGDLFWKAYPRKEEKLSAMKKLATLRKAGAVTFADLMAGVQRYCAAQREPQFTKQPTVWLNKGCWADEIQPGANNGHRTNGFHSNPTAGPPPTRDSSVIAGMGRALDRRRADRAAANGNGELRGHPDAASADAAEREPATGDDGPSGQLALVPAGHAGQ